MALRKNRFFLSYIVPTFLHTAVQPNKEKGRAGQQSQAVYPCSAQAICSSAKQRKGKAGAAITGRVFRFLADHL